MKVSDQFLKTRCACCGGSIEFPRDGIGMMVECPHCAKATSLIPSQNPNVLRRAALLTISVVAFVVLAASCVYWLIVERSRSQARQAQVIFIDAFRYELIGLQLALEKGVPEAEFRARSRLLVAKARSRVSEWGSREKELLASIEIKFDAIIYFWPRFNERNKCLRVNEVDGLWLTRMDLNNDTNVWRAFDFQAEFDDFKSTQRAKTELVAEVVDGVAFNSSLKLQIQIDALKEQERFLVDQNARTESTLDDAARRQEDFDPSYVLKRLLTLVGVDMSMLDQLLKAELAR